MNDVYEATKPLKTNGLRDEQQLLYANWMSPGWWSGEPVVHVLVIRVHSFSMFMDFVLISLY